MGKVERVERSFSHVHPQPTVSGTGNSCKLQPFMLLICLYQSKMAIVSVFSAIFFWGICYKHLNAPLPTESEALRITSC